MKPSTRRACADLADAGQGSAAVSAAADWYPAHHLPLADLLRGRFGHAIDNVCVRTTNRSLLAWAFAPRPRGQKPLPTVLLRTIGRTSGRVRTKIIPAYRANSGFVLCATNHGTAANPAWVLNLLAHPRCSVYWHGRWRPFVARVAEGAERARLTADIGPVHGPLPHFAAIAAENGRVIPLLVLEPAGPKSAADDLLDSLLTATSEPVAGS